MRTILNYPQLNKEKIESMKSLIDSIAENPCQKDCAELNELNRITGKNYTGMEFAEYWGWTDLNTLAEKASLPEPPFVQDSTRNEIEEIVAIIKAALISDDNKAEYYLELLHKSLPLPDVLKYIRLEEDEETITDNMLLASSRSVIAQ